MEDDADDDEVPAPAEEGDSKEATNGMDTSESVKNDSSQEAVQMEEPKEEPTTQLVNEGPTNNATEDIKEEKTIPEEDDEVDPLDAYMMQINEDVKKLKQVPVRKAPEKQESNQSKVSVVTVVKAKTGSLVSSKKGELLEQNADAIEFSEGEEDDNTIEMSLAKLNQRKLDQISVDHTQINYNEFRKCFYKEVPEIEKMSNQDAEKLRTQLDGIRVKGKQIPKPVQSWAQCGVSLRVLDALKRYGFEKPTPIQCQAIPIIMSGRDMIGIAKTGSGKTLAFLLPMLRHIEDQEHLEDGDGPIAIVMAPTRELALQITKEAKKFTKSMGLRAVCVYGGTGISEQIAELKRGAEIVVCTPGRMIDMLAVNSGKVTNLRRCTYVVIDEADRMFDLGFEPQVTRIVETVRPDRQTVMFSATFPRQMEALARRLLSRPIEVQVGGRSVVCSDVEQHVVLLEEHQKFLKLLELLGIYQEQGSVIVFVERQEAADELMRSLLKHSYPCMSLHGGIDQYDRDSVLQDFREGNIRLLVATSIAARGIDIRDMILVVNYDTPNHYEDYVHRCGRTGRAGNKGYAWTFLTPADAKHSGDILRALQASGVELPEDVKKMWEEYRAQMEAEGKKVKPISGFGGHGFKFDASEDNMRDEARLAQKMALGLQDEDDEAELADAIEDKVEKLFENSTWRVSDRAQVQPSQSQQAQQPVNPALPTPSQLQASFSVREKLEMAKKMAQQVQQEKVIGIEAQKINQHAASAIFSGVNLKAISAKTMAQQRAEQINAKLGYEKEEKEQEQESEQSRYYEEEIEINDLPQQVRFRLTSRDILSQISEYAECGVSVKGTHYASNKQPKDNDPRKLYVHIEAFSELAITRARGEIKRIIKEELVRMQQSQLSQLSRGRFKVF